MQPNQPTTRPARVDYREYDLPSDKMPEVNYELLNTRIFDTDLSRRAKNVVASYCWLHDKNPVDFTVRELISTPKVDILKIRTCGHKTFNELSGILHYAGVDWGEQPPMKETREHTISFGAYDSVLIRSEWTIPKGYSAKIENGKIIIEMIQP